MNRNFLIHYSREKDAEREKSGEETTPGWRSMTRSSSCKCQAETHPLFEPIVELSRNTGLAVHKYSEENIPDETHEEEKWN